MPLVPPHLIPFGAAKVNKARQAFETVINELAGENLIAQITAAGKTQLISDAVREVVYYGSIGSLWEAYAAVERIKITPEMAPFLTEERKAAFKNRLIEEISKL